MNIHDLPKMIDLSCVKTDITMNELTRMVELAKQYQFICCFAMPFYTEWLIKQLENESGIMVGGTVGFPSGADLTSTKAFTAQKLFEMGCDEIDMVINVSALKNAEYQRVSDDINAVRERIGDKPLKVILEVTTLTDYEIRKGSELAVANGAAFVKTGTGWCQKPTTVEHIRLIRDTIGTDAKIKAAGGVRTLAQIEEMVDAGCSRFGIGLASTQKILKEAGIWQD